MNFHHHRKRGIIAVQNNIDANGILNELKDSFDTFKANNTKRHKKLEDEIDGINSALAASRLGGSPGPLDSDPKTRKAVAAFGSFTKSGMPEAMNALLPNASMRTNDDPKGGYLVPEEVSREIVARQLDLSPMRRLATVRLTKSDSWEELMNAGGSTAKWVGETESRPETDSPNLRALNYPSFEIYANPSVSQKLLDDSDLDVGAFIIGNISEEFDLKEGAAFVTGTGINQPRGFLSYDMTADKDAARPFGKLQYIPTGVALGLSDSTHNGTDALIDTVYSLKAGYRRSASWVMNSATGGALSKLKDGDDNYIWRQSVILGQPNTLLGYPVEFDENMPDIGANSTPIAFGDFKKGYLINDRIGTRILRDPFTNKPFVMFYTTKRVGGGLRDSNAIKLLKVATS